ncbi:PREDICTED: uncharacterized protein LOC106120589 [Papilio xuthus]|uniref:Uncharacterized protein LOC106120589 n=1 Tax=Papilio xuthus TaxID=66420 RepID=A0AAJ6ZF52_PAPXU|nr:PREDICTED: uncharacterized protein LOC106120589 [Papilio xuthus]
MSEIESERNIDGRKQMKDDKQIVLHKVSDAWLRVYPAPKKIDEGLCSIVIRCIFCQLGLTAVLVVWNVIWVFIIHSFEGPQEVKVSLDFEKEQNQLVIDLATELRQITPLSSKWREAIEQRINDARQLTMLAVGNGAKLQPGLFWDLPGTFLFSIYVMTALGFGAPVPHTTWGRMSALIYAIIAVPTHIYLKSTSTSNNSNTLEKPICRKFVKLKYSTKSKAAKLQDFNILVGAIPISWFTKAKLKRAYLTPEIASYLDYYF